MKRSVLTAEVNRRLINTKRVKENKEEVENIPEDFSSKMRRNRYNEEDVEDKMECGIVGYERRVKRCEEEGRDLHRNGSDGMMRRRVKKVTEKSSWYKRKRDQGRDEEPEEGVGVSNKRMRTEENEGRKEKLEAGRVKEGRKIGRPGQD